MKSTTYDAEGRLKTSTINTATATFEYDGEGRRVKKGNETYVYDAFGNLAAEYGGTVAATGTRYLTTDHLGSTRLITNADGAVDQRIDYLPFGKAIPNGVSGRATGQGYQTNNYLDPLKPGFTGKDRDGETGLDYFGARYMSAAQGRFTSADAPFADQDESAPQSWNLYPYARNNPLRYIDPDGRRVQVCITGGQCFEVEDSEYPGLGPGNPGVVLPQFQFGRDQFSIGLITCGGQACGTATYINDNPGLTPVLHPLQDFRDQIAPLNPRNWLGAGIRGNVKTFAAQSGRGRPQIHSGKQGKHIPGHNNFQPGKSELTHPNPQALLDRSAGKGQRISTSKEAVDFGETIGTWVGPQGQRATTTKGVIHYDSSGGAHIVPARP